MDIKLQRQQAAQIVLDRRAARSDLNKWSLVCGNTPAKHHVLLNDYLMKAARREIRKLAIFMPPGSAKSTYGSVQFPPYFLAQRKNSGILVCSHSGDLAEGFGRRARNLIELHEKTLGYALKSDSKAAGRWETDNGGFCLTAGVGAGISGNRADLGLIDDPIGKKEDADSKLIRDKQWDWYNFDFKPRLKPDAVQVIIQTRWHEDDLGGRLLNPEINPEANQWTVIRLPFFAEENDPLGREVGQMLWDTWFQKDMYPTDPRVAQSLYQNNPTPEKGNFFSAEHVCEYGINDLPKDLRIYIGSDHAVSTKEENDFSCFLVAGVDHLKNIWVLDWYWEKVNTLVQAEQMCRLAKEFKPITWWAEKGHISGSIEPFLNVMMNEKNVYIPIEQVTSSKDKQTRAQSIKGRVLQRKVYFPRFHPQWSKAKHELLSFPAGKYDDFVDALSEIGQGLDRMPAATKTETTDEKFDSPTMTLNWIKRADADFKAKQSFALLDK